MDRLQTGDMPSGMYDSRGGRTVVVITVCSIVVTVIVGLRFYVRFGIIKNPGVDDWVLAAALVCIPSLFFEPTS